MVQWKRNTGNCPIIVKTGEQKNRNGRAEKHDRQIISNQVVTVGTVTIGAVACSS